jgi:hypothetical protein
MTMEERLFSSWDDLDSPTWPQRSVVIAGFAVSGFLAGAAAAVLPMVELHLHNMLHAAIAATLSAIPISASYVRTSRLRSHGKVAVLSLLVVCLAYAVFAVGLPLAVALINFWHPPPPDPDSYNHWPMAALIGVMMPAVTWKVYLPAGLLAGYTIAYVIRLLWPLSTRSA